MGATVVDTSLNSANWAKQKPSDYQNKDLDKALKAYESLAAKGVTMPGALPTMPKPSIKAIGTCVKELESAIKEFQKSTAGLTKLNESLKAVNGAASKASAELQKMAKDKQGEDKQKFISAASVASGLGSQASSMISKFA